MKQTKTLTDLEQTEAYLLLELDKIRKQIRTVRLLEARDKWGIVEGKTDVLFKGKRYKIYTIETDWFTWNATHKPWIVGNPYLANGKLSAHRRNLYSEWEVLTESTPQ